MTFLIISLGDEALLFSSGQFTFKPLSSLDLSKIQHHPLSQAIPRRSVPDIHSGVFYEQPRIQPFRSSGLPRAATGTPPNILERFIGPWRAYVTGPLQVIAPGSTPE